MKVLSGVLCFHHAKRKDGKCCSLSYTKIKLVFRAFDLNSFYIYPLLPVPSVCFYSTLVCYICLFEPWGGRCLTFICGANVIKLHSVFSGSVIQSHASYLEKNCRSDFVSWQFETVVKKTVRTPGSLGFSHIEWSSAANWIWFVATERPILNRHDFACLWDLSSILIWIKM